jgi:flagellar motor switch protein FliM
VSSGLLSDDQVQALVDVARDTGQPGAPPRGVRRPQRVRVIDFSRLTKLSQEQERGVRRAHDGFSRRLSTRLAGELRMPIELELIRSDQLALGAALSAVRGATMFALVETDPPETRMLLGLEVPFLLQALERMLGGNGRRQPPRDDLTDLELTLARRQFASIVEQLSLTWEDLIGAPLHLGLMGANPANLHLAPLSESTLTLTFEFRMAHEAYNAWIVIPYRAIEPYLGQLAEQTEGNNVDHAVAAVRTALAQTSVEVRVEVGSTPMSVDDVLRFREGDVLLFDAPAEAGVTICVDNVPLHRAKPGRRGAKRAVEVVERLEVES